MSTSGARGRDRSAPVYYVQIGGEGGKVAPVDLTDRVMALEYQDDEKKADLLKLTVNNWDLSNFDDPIWKQGNIIIVSWGYPGFMAPPRECVIQKVTGAQTLTVEAQSKAVLLNKEVKSRTFENKTHSDVVAFIAKEHGYEGEKADIQSTPVTMPFVTQGGLTDAQFIKSLADKEGFEFYVDFDGLHWHERRMGQKPLRVLQWFLPPDVGDIISFNVENDIFAKPGQVTAKGRDPLAKKDVTATANDASTKRDAASPVPEIVDPQTGVITLGTNAASSATKATAETSDQQAKREADGIFKRTQQSTVKLNLEIIGDPGIVAKSVLDVRGMGRRLSTLYYVNNATHSLGSGGYKVALKTSTDGTHGHQELIAGSMAGAGKVAAASKKKVNDKAADPNDPADPGALEPVEVPDPVTGVIKVVYLDKRGREGPKKS